jgi:flavin-dependent dehydrogenase
LAENGVFLAGDAAGLTHPVTGAGIPQAIASGMEAGRAAAAWAGGDTSAATRYQNEIMGRYGRFLDRGSAARRELDEHWNHDGLAAALGRAWLGKRATRR